eukprot:augustus_masked-scaffold_13-processed-gene-1.8-mRNA-1 protein AED:0.03 eAED:0.03 QI:0/-1/0/1/-1/1/1/0/183
MKRIEIKREREENPKRDTRDSRHFHRESNDTPPKKKQKANFSLSGALGKDRRSGNQRNGVALKYSEPLEAAKPDMSWRFYVYKKGVEKDTIYLEDQSAFIVGSDKKVCDIKLKHKSVSKQHAAIQFRRVKKSILPYLIDLESRGGTFINGEEIEAARYYELKAKDRISFARSSREFYLLHNKL